MANDVASIALELRKRIGGEGGMVKTVEGSPKFHKVTDLQGGVRSGEWARENGVIAARNGLYYRPMDDTTLETALDGLCAEKGVELSDAETQTVWNMLSALVGNPVIPDSTPQE